jgi:hypothetical protein
MSAVAKQILPVYYSTLLVVIAFMADHQSLYKRVNAAMVGVRPWRYLHLHLSWVVHYGSATLYQSYKALRLIQITAGQSYCLPG